jgi:hypothetical protein
MEGNMSDEPALPPRSTFLGSGAALSAPPANSASAKHPTKSGPWQALKTSIGSDIKNIGFAGLVGTAIVAYFQSLAAYQDKVATLAKADMEAATTTFSDTSTKLSRALSLQQRLVVDFYEALPNDAFKNDNAYLTKDGQATYKSYAKAYSALHQDYNLLARDAEIYLDWASDRNRDPATNGSGAADPINISELGAVDFDCEKQMPARGESKITVKKGGKALQIDWNSAKHNILTIEYCFDVTHRNITAALEWGSASPVTAAAMDIMTKKKDLLFDVRPTNQILRLNAFMGLAMNEIEQIRVKYRPTGFVCNLPGVRELIGQRCTPVRVASG